MLRKYIILFSIFLVIGCNDSKTKETKGEESLTRTSQENTVVNGLGELLNKESRALVEGWGEYQILNEELDGYYNITTEEALFKAKDISNYAKELRDSIRINFLDRPDVKIRLNVFYTSALRLSDMETIKSIKSDEVKAEITNMLNAFSAINSKINNIVIQRKIEKELTIFGNNLNY